MFCLEELVPTEINRSMLQLVAQFGGAGDGGEAAASG